MWRRRTTQAWGRWHERTTTAGTDATASLPPSSDGSASPLHEDTDVMEFDEDGVDDDDGSELTPRPGVGKGRGDGCRGPCRRR